MSVEISKNQRNFLEEIAIRHGFENYTITLDRGSTKGDNYVGTIIHVKISEISTGKQLSLLLKAAPIGDSLREKMLVDLVYNREYFIYSVVFREFSDLLEQVERAGKPVISPKFYGGLMEHNNECLVLENLSEFGFKLWNRKKPMDVQHVSIAMSQYGKLHGLSYALRKLRPGKFAEIAGNLKDIFDGKWSVKELKPSFDSFMAAVYKAVEGNEKATDGLKRFIDNFENLMSRLMSVRDKFDVILHADCWCNNMLFKYEDNSQNPSDIRLIDWQLSKIGNPVLDLSYFLLACSSKACLEDYTKFLKIYHESLLETLSLFDIRVTDAMTYEELEDQWRINAQYGMYLSFLVIKVMLAEQEEATDIGELAEADKNIMDLFDINISREDEYWERIRIVVEFMVENGFI